MISCQQYDYLEIACLYHYTIRLVLVDGTTIEGIAVDTSYNQDKQECLVLKTADDEQYVKTEQLKSMLAITKNPHFSLVEFSQ